MSAPGRLNLLGEYIDFWVVRACRCRCRTAPMWRVRCVVMVCCAGSLQMPGDERTVVIRDIQPGHLKGWFTYVAGVAWAMNQEGGRDIMLPDEVWC